MCSNFDDHAGEQFPLPSLADAASYSQHSSESRSQNSLLSCCHPLSPPVLPLSLVSVLVHTLRLSPLLPRRRPLRFRSATVPHSQPHQHRCASPGWAQGLVAAARARARPERETVPASFCLLILCAIALHPTHSRPTAQPVVLGPVLP